MKVADVLLKIVFTSFVLAGAFSFVFGLVFVGATTGILTPDMSPVVNKVMIYSMWAIFMAAIPCIWRNNDSTLKFRFWVWVVCAIVGCIAVGLLSPKYPLIGALIGMLLADTLMRSVAKKKALESVKN
ncbi:MAG: hypothetical protein CL676_02985 [Bdellovibrionaceae bacterium]|nr:hypothetical protein [Pseudobdellovibrionaceae bacterium]|tara:strand:- start:4940 stop:5323 length:384 start_codon:yes stop_codon:yes gene_type:complete